MGFDIYEWSQRFSLSWLVRRRGEQVGSDQDGNRYYIDRRSKGQKRERRWVVFGPGPSEATRVPPEWHAWLHHQVQAPPSGDNPWRRSWQKPHEPNATGTGEAYLPPGHALKGGTRAPATGDYEPWTPN